MFVFLLSGLRSEWLARGGPSYCAGLSVDLHATSSLQAAAAHAIQYVYTHGVVMATKTITVDLEAYNRLKKAKQSNESFSETIKRVVTPPPDLDVIMRETTRRPFSDDFVAVVEKVVATRRKRSRRNR